MKTITSRLLIALSLLTASLTVQAQTDLELVCPCTVENVGLTGVSINAGIINNDTTASGSFRFVLVSENPETGEYFPNAFYEFTESLAAGASIASAGFKAGLMLTTTAESFLVLRLEEWDGSEWQRVDQIRMRNTITLSGDGGESRLVLVDGQPDEERSGALFFDGTPTVTIDGATATIDLPPLVNSQAYFDTGPLQLDILQNPQPNGFTFDNGLFAVEGVELTSSLSARTQIDVEPFQAEFSDARVQIPESVYLNLLITDTSLGTSLLYETVANFDGELPTRSLAEQNVEIVLDNDGDDVPNYIERTAGTDPDDATSVPDDPVVDVLFVYSQSVAALYDGDPSARFDQLISLGNTVMANSGLTTTLRLVTAIEKTINEQAEFSALLDLMDAGAAPFDDLDSLQEATGADVVILLLPFVDGSDLCGLANLSGFGTDGDMIFAENARLAHGVVYVDDCDDTTTIHEIGHIMGLGHSRRQDGREGGTFSWSVGYGVDALFVTTMAYGSAFNDAPEVLNFSSPELVCESVACGVPRTDTESGADSVLTLRSTSAQVARFAAEVPIVDTDGDGTLDSLDSDDDGDGVSDEADAFPKDASETEDTDGDGVGNNADQDDDGDGVADAEDAFPLDGTETIDSDGDGIGDKADTDDDNDGVSDVDDAFPMDASESSDCDSDGTGDEADNDDFENCTVPPFTVDADARAFGQFEERVLEAYLAYFGRPGDLGGLAYWSGQLENVSGNLDDIIFAFGTAEEFDRRFGDLSNEALIDNLYAQILGRDPDAGGRAFWIGELDSGNRSLQEISLSIFDGVQNDDILTVSNRLGFAKLYVSLLESGTVTPLSDVALADLVATIDQTPESLNRAIINLALQ